MTESARPDSVAQALDLSAHVSDIEQCLSALDAALVSGESAAIEEVGQRLQRSLADSLAAFRHATHEGKTPLSPELKQRLMLAQSRITAQQALVHRSGAAIERTLNILLPREESPTYGAPGQGPAGRVANAYKS
ncbi:MAG: hypothetical protein KGL57_00615 [Burkholderiales bacterium]|nr:hypothetical protein [Burkholderiales bacterium]